MSNQTELDVEVNEEELTAAEDELRNKTLHLSKKIDSDYWELGGCLYSVFDGLPGGYKDNGDGSRARRTELFRKWGYKNFAEYVEKEIGIRKRSAENLRYAYYYFEKKLRLPKEVKEEVKALGRSKVYLLAGIVKEDDIMTWLGKAKVSTFEVLKEEIKTINLKKADSSIDTGIVAENPELPSPVPAPEKLHTIQFGLYDSQYQTYEQALEKAQGMTGSDKKGHNVELICLDFLANNGSFQSTDEERKDFLKKVESKLGVQLIALDMKTGKVIHNEDLLVNKLKDE